MMRARPRFGPTIKEFVVHIAIGLVLFLLIAVAAILLDLLVAFLTSKGINEVIIAGLTFAEYAVFGIDVLLLISYVGSVAILTVRDVWRRV